MILRYIRQWMREGALPAVPIVVDSPLTPRICLVHGDIENATILARDLEEERFSRVRIPGRAERVGLS